jgi:hypothetical protein
MTPNGLETWHRREAEDSCVAPKQRIAVVSTMRRPLKVPKKARDRARWHLAAADLLASLEKQ